MTTSGPAGFVPNSAAQTAPNYVTDADQFNEFYLMGVLCPGLAKVTFSKKHDWKIRKSKGASGATMTYEGSGPVEFSVEFLLWLPAHFDAWAGWASMQRKTLKVPASGGTTGGQTANVYLTSYGNGVWFSSTGISGTFTQLTNGTGPTRPR